MRRGDPAELLDDDALEESSVVANSSMNRERGLIGANSYTKELGFSPIDYLLARCAPAAWLDLCCGRGRTLLEAAAVLRDRRPVHSPRLVGIDLVDQFDVAPGLDGDPDLISTSVSQWTPSERFDLITCVHGLHYIGDKIELLSRVARWLTDDGLFVALLDLQNIHLAGSPNGNRRVARTLRANGFEWNARRHQLKLQGRREVELSLHYVGSSVDGGPNYTGQPAVDSHYAMS